MGRKLVWAPIPLHLLYFSPTFYVPRVIFKNKQISDDLPLTHHCIGSAPKMRWTKYRENQTRCIGKSDTVYWRIRCICIRYNLNPRSVHAIFQWAVYIQLLSDLNNFLDYSLSEWHFPFKVESKINSNFIFSNWGFILPDYFCHTKDGIIRLHSYLRASRKLNFKTWKGGGGECCNIEKGFFGSVVVHQWHLSESSVNGLWGNFHFQGKSLFLAQKLCLENLQSTDWWIYTSCQTTAWHKHDLPIIYASFQRASFWMIFTFSKDNPSRYSSSHVKNEDREEEGQTEKYIWSISQYVSRVYFYPGNTNCSCIVNSQFLIFKVTTAGPIHSLTDFACWQNFFSCQLFNWKDWWAGHLWVYYG